MKTEWTKETSLLQGVGEKLVGRMWPLIKSGRKSYHHIGNCSFINFTETHRYEMQFSNSAYYIFNNS